MLSRNVGKNASASFRPEPEGLVLLVVTAVICVSGLIFLISVIRGLYILGPFLKNQIVYLFIFTIGSFFVTSDLFFIIITFFPFSVDTFCYFSNF